MLRYLSFALVAVLTITGLIIYPALSEILAGVALMLLAVLNLEQGFKILTESTLSKILKRSTDSYFKSLLAGIVATALISSSSLVSVLVLSFLSAGLITLKSGIAVMYGSNIGTTFTAWLIAVFGLNFKISGLALPMVILGVFTIFQKKRSLKGSGYAILGLGFLFLGIHYLKTGFEALTIDASILGIESPGFWGLMLLVGAGTVLTIILQSSAASLAIILTAIASQQISYIEGLALVIGMNIGTTFTAIIGSIASGSQGKKMALSHLLFNLITAVITLALMPQFKALIDIISTPLGISSGDYAIKLAMFHTVFNFFGLLIMSPWIQGLTGIMDKIIKEEEADYVKTKFLTKSILDHPQSTIHALLKETEHLLDHTFEIIAHGLNVHREDLLKVDKVSLLLQRSRDTIPINIDEEYLIKVKHIYSKIIKYGSLAQQKYLTAREQETISNIKYANRLIVAVIKDLQEFHKNLNTYLSSDNEYLRDNYERFRKRLVKIIKELFINVVQYPYQNDRNRSTVLGLDDSQLEKMKENIDHQLKKISELENDINQITSELITERLIKSKMASSIINDSVYVTRIGTNLLKVLELLYAEISDIDLDENELKNET